MSTHNLQATRKNAHQRRNHMAINPVTMAVVKRRILEDVERLRTAASLHAFMGEDGPTVVNLVARVVYIVCYAAGIHDLGRTPEASILAGTANALGDLADSTAGLESQRNALIAGLAAIDRLMPKLSVAALAAGALHLDHLLLTTNEMTTKDVRTALLGGGVS